MRVQMGSKWGKGRVTVCGDGVGPGEEAGLALWVLGWRPTARPGKPRQ